MKKNLLSFLFLSFCSLTTIIAQPFVANSAFVAVTDDSGTFGYSLVNSPAQPRTFNGYDFGTTDVLTLFAGNIDFNNNGRNVTAVSLQYAVYPVGGTVPAYTSFPLEFLSENAGTNAEVWHKPNSINVDWKALATDGDGQYQIAVTFEVTYDANLVANAGFTYGAVFTVESPADALPVSMTAFDATGNKGQVELTWTTEREVNNDYFSVERKAGNGDWKVIGRTEGNGSTDTESFYSFTDESALNGVNVYRLHQFDFDGRSEYSATVQAEVFTRDEMNIYPNPTAGAVTIDIPTDYQGGKLSLYDVTGKQISSVNVETQNSVSFGDLPQGVYVVRLTDAAGNNAVQSILRKM